METIAELPGFTRGLAFVGLLQVRETNVFGGIPLTQRVAERQCGVWVVDLRTGGVVAFLRFEGDVREIFDAQVLHGLRWPELLEIDSRSWPRRLPCQISRCAISYGVKGEVSSRSGVALRCASQPL